MLYTEFLEGTGCRDNDHNYKVYKDLELVYMNSDCTKDYIYDMGKKLVNNEKTAEQVLFEKEINNEIASLKKQRKEYQERAKQYKELYSDVLKETGEKDEFWKSQEIFYKKCMRTAGARIKELKWLLSL